MDHFKATKKYSVDSDVVVLALSFYSKLKVKELWVGIDSARIIKTYQFMKCTFSWELCFMPYLKVTQLRRCLAKEKRWHGLLGKCILRSQIL